MASDKFTPAPFKHSFVDVSEHLPDVRASVTQASAVATGVGAMTKGSVMARARAATGAFMGSLVEQSALYAASGKASKVFQGVQQNNLAADERRSKHSS
ncbi:MAG TPA: hypothetical protein VFW00_05605 [Rhodocyclaceae bacterium]|nr:hypothetical protein [Rhodocyclaceae bacterium]